MSTEASTDRIYFAASRLRVGLERVGTPVERARRSFDAHFATRP